MKRKKRLQKGIEALEEQIAAHEEKQETATKRDLKELVDYYQGEIERFKKRKENREEKLNRKKPKTP